MGQFVINTLWCTLISSILILILWALSPLLNKRYVSKWKYWIWLIIAVRLILPVSFVLPETSINIESPDISLGITPFQTTPIEQGGLTDCPEIIQPGSIQSAMQGLSFFQLLFFVWLIGFTIFTAIQLIQYFMTKRRLLRWSVNVESTQINERLAHFSKFMNIKKIILPMKNGEVGGPMIIGLLHPILILPNENYESSDLDYIIRHELIHYQHKDIIYKMILFLANAIHWYNPIIYLMVREANADLEMVCDDEVTKGCTFEECRIYSEVILASISHSKLCGDIFTTSFYFGTNKMKARFANIMNMKKRKNGVSTLLAIAVSIFLIGSLTGFTLSDLSSINPDNQSSGQDMTLTVTDSNTIVRYADGDNYSFDYDNSLYEVNMEQSINTTNIQIALKENASPTIEDFVYINIPEIQYQSVTIISTGSGISMPEINCNLNITSDQSATAINVPSDFNSSISFSATNSSGALNISSNSKNYTLSVNVDDSSISVDKSLPSYFPGTNLYEYTNGNAEASIMLYLRNCAYAINIIEK